MLQDPERCWYVRDSVAQQPRQIWFFDGRTAMNMGVTNPEIGGGTYFKAEPGECIWDCIKHQTPWLDPNVTEGYFHLMICGPGQFYRRIARPLLLSCDGGLWSYMLNEDKMYMINARRQLSLLISKLEAICHIVQPSKMTLDVYGHEIRNLLILAAAEVEMHWRGILGANGVSSAKFTTNDYIKLIKPLGLAEFEVTFIDFPDLQIMKPFAEWSETNPTKSLEWYDAYHGVKHNREGEFQRGTLRRVFEAISACVALMVAQFGYQALGETLARLINLKVPSWPIEEMYFLCPPLSTWTAINYPGL